MQSAVPLSDLIIRSVTQVFETMVNLRPAVVSKTDEIGPFPVDGVAGTVGFAGGLSGHLYLVASEPAAFRIAANMLGTDAVAPADLKDVIGEITNMLTGGLKNQLDRGGIALKLTVPTFLRATATTISDKGASIGTHLKFSAEGSTVVFDVHVLAHKP
jgi:chemotaxis protein CheX